MKRYKSKTPRMAIGLAAVAMTALTFGLSVVAPAQTAAATHEAMMQASAAPIEVVIAPGRIDVVAAREQRTDLGAVRVLTPRKGQPG